MYDLNSVRDMLEANPDSKWSWVIYRTTYGDDAEWERFMNHLNTRIRLKLEAEGTATCSLASIGLYKMTCVWRMLVSERCASKLSQ
ncbi:hypothetical protein BU26DRAFT_524407 [Trematosphaeria pertusa]|uniref:Uncharacterized protein n=1 Tax=Trematosphaeria pertusa TaxID=390896 RepID=A0A6A6HVY6_9PLEO|nr:uncharacterized protein BU26DRAFT_524407 [Trematosphaeria pertusa]KAF2242217.1 hypothetical protein BU26DRAFT_524407 [Trematosphaeria pertusa]